MKKYNNKANIIGEIIKKHREDRGYSKEEVCRQLQLHGVYVHRIELYRMEKSISMIKDFELVALCKVLDIDYDKEIKNLVE